MTPAIAVPLRTSLAQAICAKLLAPLFANRAQTLAVRIFLLVPGQAPTRLVWTDKHPDSVAGCGVLRFKNRSDRLDLAGFRELRDKCGATIKTNHLGRVVRALGVSKDEPGIEVDDGDS
jgi:hypothetical protein